MATRPPSRWCCRMCLSNTLGTLDYAAGTVSSFPSGATTLATIEFVALKVVTVSDLQFIFQAPRLTDVTYGGASILTQHGDGQVTIGPANNTIFLPKVVS